MNKLLCTAIALTVMAGMPAVAADMPLKAPPAVIVPSWTGFYLGLGVGFRSTETLASVTSSTHASANINCSAAVLCISDEPLSGIAFRLSPYLGINWQIASQWVLGLEGDWGGANQTTTLGGIRYPDGHDPYFSGRNRDSFAVKTTWDASVRARVGFLADPSFLFYLTGGPAWLHFEATATCDTVSVVVGRCSAGIFSPGVTSNSYTKTGWTFGGGIEALLWSNWIVRAEYRYADFGHVSSTDTRTCGGSGLCVGFAADVVSYDVRVRTHTATFGLAYKFGDPVSAPAAGGLAPVYKAPPAVVASWSGTYIGLGVGARAARIDGIGVSDVVDPGGLAGFGNCAAAGTCVPGEPLDGTAFRISPYAGYNWQFAPLWVAGVEADFGFTNKTTTLGGMVYPASGFMPGHIGDAFSVKTTWDASVRARLGYLIKPAILAFATVGPAWLRIDSTSTCIAGDCIGFENIQPPIGHVFSHAQTKLGWTAGGGFEALLWRHWLARGEYRYADFGKVRNSDGVVCPGVCEDFTSETLTYDVRVRTHTVTLGLAYKFDPSNPVVAKY